MGDKSDDRNLMVEFTAEGQVRPSVKASEHLKSVGGLWRLVPEVGQMMLLERVGKQATGDERRQIRLAGSFETNNELHNALSMIAMGQQDGALHVSNGEHHKVLYFRKGVLLSARSNLPEDRLGNLLVKVGLLSQEELEKCLPEVRAGSPLGTVLVAQGIMTTPKVYDGLRRQTEEIFYSILPWQTGAFYLIAPLDMTDVPAMLHLDTTGLLMDGVRLLDEKGREEPQDAENDLRRIEPVSAAELPADGLHVIVETYSKALSGLFSSVGETTSQRLRQSVRGFIQDSLPFQELFFGVDVGKDGTLSAKALIENVAAELNDSNVRNMQLGLSEILFFALFAAGEEVTPELEQEIQGQVAAQLRALPKAVEREEGAPRPTSDVSETSRVNMREYAALTEARGEKAAPVAAVQDESSGGRERVASDSQIPPIPKPDSAPVPLGDPVLSLEDDDEDGEARSENSVIAAIVDEEFSVEHFDEDDDDGVVVEPVGPNHSEPLLLNRDEKPASKPDDSFELSLDQDEEIMTLLDKVAEAQAEEAASRSQAGLLPTKPRSPSSEFDRMLSSDSGEEEPAPPEDSSEAAADK